MRYPRDLVPSDYTVKHWVLNPSGARKIHICTVVASSGDTVGIGHAICNPTDEYDSERGREIAQGRAIKQWSDHGGMKRTRFDELRDEDKLLSQIEEIYAFPAVLGGPDRLS